MTGTVAALSTSIAVALLVLALMFPVSSERRRSILRMAALERQARRGTDPESERSALRDDSMSGSSRVNSLLRRYDWSTRTATLLERADVPLKVGEYVLILIGIFVGLGIAIWAISGIWFVGLAFGVGGIIAVRFWVGARAQKRLIEFNKQLPVALESMSVSIRSGFSIMESVRTVARETEPPISLEFSRLLDEARVGGSFETGLKTMVDRVKSADLQIVARAVELHRRVGGELAAILESVAQTMREREELRGHVLALTAQQRFGGLIVALLPVWVIGFMAVASPEFVAPLWEETAGRQLLAISVVMELVGLFVMRQILKIEV